VPQEIADIRLRALFSHWLSRRRGAALPRRADIDPVELPGEVWPHTMLLDVLRSPDGLRFRYRRVGAVFWRAPGQEPTGRFLDEVLPATAGYRDYIIGIYREMVERRSALYTENELTLQGQKAPMRISRVSLPLSSDGESIDMALAGHVFESGALARERAFSLVRDLKEVVRRILAE
jgi:hypothetical protein